MLEESWPEVLQCMTSQVGTNCPAAGVHVATWLTKNDSVILLDGISLSRVESKNLICNTMGESLRKSKRVIICGKVLLFNINALTKSDKSHFSNNHIRQLLHAQQTLDKSSYFNFSSKNQCLPLVPPAHPMLATFAPLVSGRCSMPLTCISSNSPRCICSSLAFILDTAVLAPPSSLLT